MVCSAAVSILYHMILFALPCRVQHSTGMPFGNTISIILITSRKKSVEEANGANVGEWCHQQQRSHLNLT
jgi:hypothetical protein